MMYPFSNEKSGRVATYIWPALREASGTILHKAVVVTWDIHHQSADRTVVHKAVIVTWDVHQQPADD